MRIAVASQNFRTVSGHAGKTRRFLVFEAGPGQPAQEVERFDLPREMAMHDFHGEGPHPLDTVDAVIAASAGDGFARRMAARGVLAAVTEEPDPGRAVEALLEQMRQNPPIPDFHLGLRQHHHHAHGGCGGNDDHDAHDHHHGHSDGCSCRG